MPYPHVTRFKVRDYVCSDEHPYLATRINPSELAEWKLYYIHTTLILTIHNETGLTPYIESGLRSPQLNEAVGSKSRQHMDAEAVDITFPEHRSETINVFNFIKRELYHSTGYCILYLDMDRKRFRQIHWALPLGPNRPPRKNPRRFWYYDGDNFRSSLPSQVLKWE